MAACSSPACKYALNDMVHAGSRKAIALGIFGSQPGLADRVSEVSNFSGVSQVACCLSCSLQWLKELQHFCEAQGG